MVLRRMILKLLVVLSVLTNVQCCPTQVLPNIDAAANSANTETIPSHPASNTPNTPATLDTEEASVDAVLDSTRFNAIPDPNANSNASHRSSLQRRPCNWVPDDSPEGGDWYCNTKWPSMPEMIARMRDTSDHGQATKDNRVFWYTNLRKPTAAEDPTGTDFSRMMVQEQWMMGWLKAKGIPGWYYRNAVRPGWFGAQRAWIYDNDWQMDTTQLAVFQPEAKITTAAQYANTFMWCYFQAMAMATLHPDVCLFARAGDWDPSSVWARVEYWKLTSNPVVQRIYRVNPAPGASCAKEELLWDRTRGEKELSRVWSCPILEHSFLEPPYDHGPVDRPPA